MKGSGVSPREMPNLVKHMDHLTILAGGTAKQRRMVLDRADARLVHALSAAAKMAHAGGGLSRDVYTKHGKKLEIAISPTRALKTKHKLVTSQRGGGFWSSIAKAALPIVGGLVGTVAGGGPIAGAIGGAAGKALASAI